MWNAVSPVAATSTLPQDDASKERRRFITETLLATINGCLRELEYSPQLVHDFRQLQMENASLRNVNDRLLTDNTAMADLREDIRALVIERDSLRQKYQHVCEENAKLRTLLDQVNAQMKVSQNPNEQPNTSRHHSATLGIHQRSNNSFVRNVIHRAASGSMAPPPPPAETVPDVPQNPYHSAPPVAVPMAMRHVPVVQSQGVPLHQVQPYLSKPHHQTGGRSVAITPILASGVHPRLPSGPRSAESSPRPHLMLENHRPYSASGVIDLTSEPDEPGDEPRKRRRVSVDAAQINHPPAATASAPPTVGGGSPVQAPPTPTTEGLLRIGQLNIGVTANSHQGPMPVNSEPVSTEPMTMDSSTVVNDLTAMEGIETGQPPEGPLPMPMDGAISTQSTSQQAVTHTQEDLKGGRLAESLSTSMENILSSPQTGPEQRVAGLHVAGVQSEIPPPAAQIASGVSPTQPESDERQFIQDCVEENYYEEEGEEDGKLYCGMCRHLYDTGHTQVPPQAVVDPTLEELVAHCESEHPRSWENLKRLAREAQA